MTPTLRDQNAGIGIIRILDEGPWRACIVAAYLEVACVVNVLEDGGLRIQVRRHIDGDVLLTRWHQPDRDAQHIYTGASACQCLVAIVHLSCLRDGCFACIMRASSMGMPLLRGHTDAFPHTNDAFSHTSLSACAPKQPDADRANLR